MGLSIFGHFVDFKQAKKLKLNRMFWSIGWNYLQKRKKTQCSCNAGLQIKLTTQRLRARVGQLTKKALGHSDPIRLIYQVSSSGRGPSFNFHSWRTNALFDFLHNVVLCIISSKNNYPWYTMFIYFFIDSLNQLFPINGYITLFAFFSSKTLIFSLFNFG
jgi:hypothetical protein